MISSIHKVHKNIKRRFASEPLDIYLSVTEEKKSLSLTNVSYGVENAIDRILCKTEEMAPSSVTMFWTFLA